MVDGTEKAKIPLKFANTQHDITNLALSTFAIALFSALQYCNSIVIFLRHKMLWQSEQTQIKTGQSFKTSDSTKNPSQIGIKQERKIEITA